MAGPGGARLGSARVTRLAYCGSFPQRVNVLAWQGVAMFRMAMFRMAGYGMVRQGRFGAWWRFRKSSGLGAAMRCMAWRGSAGLGKGFFFISLYGDTET